MNEAQRHAIYTSAVGWVQQNPGVTASEVSQWIRNHGWPEQNVHSSTALAIGDRAVRAAALGQQLWADEQRVPTVGNIPDRIGLQPDQPRFEYQVVIEAVDASGNTVTTRLDLLVDHPISFAEARALALAQLPRPGTPGKRDVRGALRADPQQEPEVHLVAVGRR